MIKKIFIVSTIILLVLLVFFGIYSIAFKSQDTQQVVTKDQKIGDGLDIANIVGGKMVNITSDPVVAATLGPNGDTIRYVDGLDGRVWTMTLRGSNKEVLMSETSGVPTGVTWSQRGDGAIVKYSNGEIFVYNYATKTKNKLRSGMDDVEWASTDGKILYKYYDEKTKERSLNIANSDGTNWKKIADLPFRYTEFMQIPSSILVAFWPMQDAQVASEIFTTSTINATEPKKIFSGGYGGEYVFSPNGKKVLVSSVKNGGITLGVMDSDGKNYTDLMVPTIVDKAVWSKDNKTVYYAQPTDVPDSAVLPNDYIDKKFTTHDTFYKMDVESGKKERIIELNEIKEKADATKIFLSPSEDALFFINRENQLLYKISL
jgi:hypothetical protein